MHIYRPLYKNLIVTTSPKFIIDVYTKKKKESKHNTKDSYQITGKQKTRKKKKYKNKPKAMNKMAVRTHV